MDEAIARVIRFMHDRLDEPMTVEDLARTARFSKFHFTRLFRRETGYSPSRFLARLRIEEAKRLLASTSMRVADVSCQVGYASVGTFTTRFTTCVGVSPMRYRQVNGLPSGGVPDNRAGSGPVLAGGARPVRT
jgi:AraC family transcriptional regulator